MGHSLIRALWMKWAFGTSRYQIQLNTTLGHKA